MSTIATRRTLSATTLIGDSVINTKKEDLGKVEDIMLDLQTGRIAYLVVSFGGFLGMGDKLFAVPFGAVQLDTEQHAFELDVSKERLKNAPGFDKDNWPDFADEGTRTRVFTFYGITPEGY